MGQHGTYKEPGWLSKITYAWVGPLIVQANKKQQRVDEDLIGEHDGVRYYPPVLNADASASRFHAAWNDGKRRSLFRTLVHLHTHHLWAQSLAVFIMVVSRLVSAVLLRDFLHWLTGGTTSIWHGVALAFALGASGLVQTVMNHQQPWYGVLMALSARNGVTSAVHSKALRLNSTSVSHVSPGFIVNLVANDVRSFDEASYIWMFLWASPLELLAVLIMVGLQLGWIPAIAGTAATIALVPIQSALIRPIASIRRATAVRTDDRVRLMSEAIQGALACKMLGWEDPLAEQVKHLRNNETSQISRMMRVRAINQGIQFVVPSVVTFITFVVFRQQAGVLSVSTVFYALSLLQLPRRTMMLFVMGIQAMAELSVSLKRFESFLHTPEPPEPAYMEKANNAHSSPEGTVAMRGATYDWTQPFGDSRRLETMPTPEAGAKKAGDGAKPAAHAHDHKTGAHGHAAPNVLHGVEFQLRPGELLGVCGEVGAGKTTLLSALLGEIQPLVSAAAAANATASGSSGYAVKPSGAQDGAIIRGSLAYCNQVPWIVSGTVRDNIVFGSPFEEVFYAKVIHAACLATDIASLPAGDLTELGERGLNLSGGQKARIALARALYARPKVALLDDPLSAVDPAVGAALWSRAVGPGGLLDGTTRILVTHQRQYLPHVDRLMVLRSGRVVALGTWQELSALNLPELASAHEAAVHVEEEEEGEEEERPAGGSFAGIDKAAGHVLASLVDQDVAGTGQASDSHGPVVESMGMSSPGSEISLSSKTGDDSSDEGDAKKIELAKLLPASYAFLGSDKAEANGQKGTGSFRSLSSLLRLSSSRPHVKSGNSMLNSQPTHRWWPRLRGDGEEGVYEQGDEEAQGSANVPGQPSAQSSGALDVDSVREDVSLLGGGRAKSSKGRRGGKGSKQGGSASAKSDAKEDAGRLVQAEGRAQGSVGWDVYGQYFLHMGVANYVSIPIVALSAQAAYLWSSYWLSEWSAAKPSEQSDPKWMKVYGILTIAVAVLGLTRALLFFRATLRASTHVHDTMVQRLLRAPLHFFHTNPTGRVLNRFSKDQGIVDEWLPNVMFDTIQQGLMVIGGWVMVAVAVPHVIPVLVPLAAIFVWQRSRYMAASREVKRWEAVTRSPIYSLFSSTLKGLPIIRAYNAQSRFRTQLQDSLTGNGHWTFAFNAIGRWIGFRLDVVSNAGLLVTALLAVLLRGKINPSLLGLALTQLLQMMGITQMFIRQSAEVENSMTSVERMVEYTQLPMEAKREKEGGGSPPPGWPRSGALTYERVWARYRPGLPPVLQDLSFTLKPGTSCGVVGRTGSGKSSLALTLFRLIDVTSGRILIDGLDVGGIGVDALRSQLAIIPQDPVLFSGTVRSNLDPWHKYPDSALWDALDAVQLRRLVSGLGGLGARMGEAGDNLSAGQRQLFCLARALLAKAPLLCLDEATANVDKETDSLIQGALRRLLPPKSGADPAHTNDGSGRVLLVIAHRIDTIMDADHLLVLGAGKLLEQGPPTALAAAPGGVFAGMAAAARAAQARHKAALPS